MAMLLWSRPMAIAPDKLSLWVKTTERLGLKALFAKDFPDYEGHWLKLIKVKRL
jgi:hypothetical protein